MTKQELLDKIDEIIDMEYCIHGMKYVNTEADRFPMLYEIRDLIRKLDD